MKKFKGIRQKVDWKQFISRATSTCRSALDLYVGVKKKEPVYIGMALASIAQTAVEWAKESPFDINKELSKMNIVPIFQQSQATFFYNILKQIGYPYVIIPINKKENSSLKVMLYDLGNTQMFFVIVGDVWVNACWGASRKEALKGFSTVINKYFGQFVLLTTNITDDLKHEPSLTRFTPQLESYLSPLDLELFCNTIQKFQDRNLNRSSLLFGPPGTGKTTFAVLVANHINGRILIIENSILDKLRQCGISLEDIVEIVGPKVILFDDLDRIGNVENLLGTIERLNRTIKDNKILLFGTVNEITELPLALRRPGRFDEIIKFDLPDESMRLTILKNHLKSEGMLLLNGYSSQIATWSEGLSGAELREIALQITVRGYDEVFIRDRIRHMLDMKGLKKEVKKSIEEIEIFSPNF